MQKKASGLPVDPSLVAPDLGSAASALGHRVTAETLGEVLQAAVAVARQADIDPETALRAAAARLRDTGQAAEEP